MRGGLFALLVVASGAGPSIEEPVLLTTAEVLRLPQPEPDVRIRYGPEPSQFGELRLASGPGPHPVAVIVHGGCWLAEYDLGYMSSLAEAIAEDGVATWSVEYRRIGEDGGGWPGTFLDVAAAADHVRVLAAAHDLDLTRVVAVGHSAGGHLALWLAARSGLGSDDPLRGSEPLPVRGVVSLAGIPDLAGYAAPEGCGAAVAGLLGGEPGGDPGRLQRASPIEMLPLGVRQTMIVGGRDTIVPAEQARRYAERARAAGDQVEIRAVEAAGHFELVVPASVAWPTVREAVLGMVE